MKAYQTVVCATEDGSCGGLKHMCSRGNFHQLLVCPSSVGPNCRQQLLLDSGPGERQLSHFHVVQTPIELQGQ